TAYLDTEQEEARAVADFVAQRRAALAAEPGRVGRPVTAAVLCRKRVQFALVEAALLARGLPVEVVGLGGLLSTPEVVDMVAALQAAHDPSRGDALMRLLTGPRARLGLADLHALADWSAQHAGPAQHSGPGQDAGPGSRGGPGAGDRAAAPDEAVREADVVDERSIVDALDALPDPHWRGRNGRGLSAVGHRRLTDLAEVLRTLRRHTFLPVVDVVAQAERLLGLDIEVAVGPATPAVARAHLDAFRAVAAAFDADEAGSLGAFLAWLEAAAVEERGLESPVGEIDPEAVQILTVHAAKGLEWDVVAVPGLVERTFPTEARPRGWVKDPGAVPTRLRGDRASLPDVDLVGSVEQAELVRRLHAYLDGVDAHHLDEERRLAYVALTRARHHLLLSGSWWRQAVRPTAPSVFLAQVHETVGGAAWIEEPGAARPEQDQDAAPSWPPVHPLGVARHERLDAAAAAVRAAGDARAGIEPAAAGAADRAGDAPLAAVADLLLDERRRVRAERTTVPVPAHLSASAVVRLADDRDAFTLALRRPVPSAPSTVARRGTAFHAWVEQYYGAAALVDVDALPGADDETVTSDADLALLRERFLASPWAGRAPVAVEVDVETPLAGLVVRSRIDAVFPEPDGGVVVVDWKTGRAPTDPATAQTRALQLAVYRIAWSRWTGVPIDTVRAAFFYVATGQTVEPPQLGIEEVEAALRGASPG
ncbi:MAG TPA: ATP-dependent DNA helicase, partial [Actinotalea sp.]|nr:ATP-dependent DNA helicase [Actinotalea sp.]